MSEPLCLKCLFNRGKRVAEKDIKERFPHNCSDCIHNTEEAPCIDGCGTIMCFCDLFGYWHNRDQPKSCFGYKKVEK